MARVSYYATPLLRSLVHRPQGVILVTREREARSEFILIYTKNLSMSGPPAVVTLLGGLYLWNRKPD